MLWLGGIMLFEGRKEGSERRMKKGFVHVLHTLYEK